MPVKIEDINRVPKLLKELRELSRKAVEVGVFGDEDEHLLMVARVHEFGVTIRPKQAKFLAIPLPKAKGTKPADYGDELFVPEGTNVLARERDGEIEPLFVLLKSVTIPERSYMRSTFDEKEKELEINLDKLLGFVLEGKLTAKELYERIGQWMVMQIQRKIRELDDPPNSKLTIETKGSSNPLIDTGRLIQSITYRVVDA